jgi:hypothetical protein
VAIGARRSAIDLILPRLVPEKPGSTFTTAVPAYWDYQARVDHRLPSGRLSLFVFGSHDDLKIVAADPNLRFDLGQHVTFHRALFTWITSFGGWTSRFRPAYGYGEERFDAAQDRGRIWNHRFYLRQDLTREVGSRLTVALGLDGLLSGDWADFDFAFPREGRTFGATKPERVVARRSYLDVAPAEWIEVRWRLTPALRWCPGCASISTSCSTTTCSRWIRGWACTGRHRAHRRCGRARAFTASSRAALPRRASSATRGSSWCRPSSTTWASTTSSPAPSASAPRRSRCGAGTSPCPAPSASPAPAGPGPAGSS